MQIILCFFRTRDWKMIFLRFSTFMFWFHFIIFLSVMLYQPYREVFLDWIVFHNIEYFMDYFNFLYNGENVKPNSPERFIVEL